MVWAGSVPARYYSAPLGSTRLPVTSCSGLFRSPPGGRAAASPAHALSVPAAFRAALCLVFTSFSSELYPGRCFPHCLRQSALDCANPGAFVASGAG